MRRDVLVLGVAFVLLATGCRTMERLSFIRPSAARGDYTQVAPTYEVSDKGRKGAPVAVSQLLANATGLYRAGRMDEAERRVRSITCPFSWPQAASMSSPRVRRTIVST